MTRLKLWQIRHMSGIQTHDCCDGTALSDAR